MIIDAHTHIFPDTQADVLLKNTADMFNVKTYGMATESELISKMDENQISYSVIHMVAPYPTGVIETNTWLINLIQPRFLSLARFIRILRILRKRLKDLKIIISAGLNFSLIFRGFFLMIRI